MPHPLVVHNRRAPYDALIDRSTRFGNPFKVGRDGSREEVIAKFALYLASQPELIAVVRRELRGRTLGCWCAPQPCHGDVLAWVANATEQEIYGWLALV